MLCTNVKTIWSGMILKFQELLIHFSNNIFLTRDNNNITDKNIFLNHFQFKKCCYVLLCDIFLFSGLAVISLCISLIQEQIGRSAAIAMGVQHHVIELDIVEIIPRRNNFLTSDETPEDIAEENNTTVIAGGAVVVPDGEESNLPGEVGDDKDEDEDGKYFYDFQPTFKSSNLGMLI